MARVSLSTGVALEVEEFGSGPPVVLVPGGAMTHRVWDHQVGALRRRYRSLAVDLRGSGASDKPPSGYSVDHFATDLAALIEQLGLERPVVVGHGLGSHVALRLAATRPGLVAGLALVSAAPWFVGERQDAAGGFPEDLWKRMQGGAARNRAQADLDLIDEAFFHGDLGEGMRLWCLGMAAEWPLAVFAQLAETLPQLDHRGVVASIDVPVLLLHGRHDEKTRYDGATYLLEHLPRARLVTLQQSAHCPHLEEPGRLNEALLEFLEDVATAAPPTAAAAAS
jgi:pimeloyl-[acyl-carrier protein] methyl ester esterase